LISQLFSVDIDLFSMSLSFRQPILCLLLDARWANEDPRESLVGMSVASSGEESGEYIESDRKEPVLHNDREDPEENGDAVIDREEAQVVKEREDPEAPLIDRREEADEIDREE
jgi:hypothetical protein